MRRLIGECMSRGIYGRCCYIYDKGICGKVCDGQDVSCKYFFRVAKWAQIPGEKGGAE